MTTTDSVQSPPTERGDAKTFRILSLDGGGAKGFYTLGVPKEIEGVLGCPLCDRFNLIFGTSTGAIIATLVALGYSVDDIHDLYKKTRPVHNEGVKCKWEISGAGSSNARNLWR